MNLPALLRASDASVRGDADSFTAVKLLLDAGTGSLGGARPKASVVDADGELLIAKFAHADDEWDVMAWEATALQLAARAGVTVARHQLVPIDGRHVHLLTRFDRNNQRRIGYISAMTALEHHDGEPADDVDIADRLAELSVSTSQDAHELFRRAALNVAVNNTDDHLRNHGFLRNGPGWELSPAFAINPNPARSSRQTSIAGAVHVEDAPAGLIELGRACRLSPGAVREMLNSIADALEAWREIAGANGIPRQETELFAETFASGINALRMA